MSMIGEITLKKAQIMIVGLIRDYAKEISMAYEKAGDALSVSLSLKFLPHRTDAIQVKATINFPLDKIKAEAITVIDENQREIPFPEEEHAS